MINIRLATKDEGTLFLAEEKPLNTPEMTDMTNLAFKYVY